MGAKARHPIQSAEQMRFLAEFNSLIRVLEVLDTTVKGVPVPTESETARHRMLVKDYVLAKHKYTDQRDHVLSLVRDGVRSQALTTAMKTLEIYEDEYTLAESVLVEYRKQLEA